MATGFFNVPPSPFEVITKNTYLEFPSVGKESAIYVDKTENQFYRWDSENLTYKKMGSDYHDIKVINGGTSKTTY